MPRYNARAVVIGSLNLDEIFTVPHIAQEGETLSAVNYHVEGGGKGANQSVSLAKAGCEVVHCGRIGRDGVWLTKHMEEVGVDVGGVVVGENEHTGRAIIQLSESTRDNSIVLFPGANHSLRLSDVKECAMKRVGQKGDWMVFQNEVRFCSKEGDREQSELIGEVIELAKSTGMFVALNPAPYTQNLSSLYPLSKMDLLVLNTHEACYLALELSASSLGTPGSSLDARFDLETLSTHLPSVRLIVVTLGTKGSITLINDGEEGREILYVPSATLAGPIMDTTGAGDIFVGYLIAGLMQGGKEQWSKELVEESLRDATKAAAMGCEKKGAMRSVPWREDVRIRSFD